MIAEHPTNEPRQPHYISGIVPALARRVLEQNNAWPPRPAWFAPSDAAFNFHVLAAFETGQGGWDEAGLDAYLGRPWGSFDPWKPETMRDEGFYDYPLAGESPASAVSAVSEAEIEALLKQLDQLREFIKSENVSPEELDAMKMDTHPDISEIVRHIDNTHPTSYERD